MTYGSGRPAPIPERLWRHIEVDGDCWLWTGSINREGYGQFNLSGGKWSPAHRASYQAFIGPIPEGLVLDHLCRVRHCVNPFHLEPVTNRENSLRGASPAIALHLSGKCQNGHDASHSYRRKSTGAVAYCKLCADEKRRLKRQREDS